MRKALTSTPGASSPGSPSVRSLTSRPASRARPSRAPRRRSEGCGLTVGGRVGVVGAQDVQQAPQLGHRLAAGVLDRGERREGAVGVGVQRAVRGLDEDEHHRDVMRDNVVQLACDAHAFRELRRTLLRGGHPQDAIAAGGACRRPRG